MSPVGFDLDMTLIDSRRAILVSFAEVGSEMSTAIDLAAVDRRLGIKLDDELAFWFPPDQVTAAAECYRRHYVQLARRGPGGGGARHHHHGQASHLGRAEPASRRHCRRRAVHPGARTGEGSRADQRAGGRLRR
jgi:phosphoglycolate phosphatase-like HAD superfamily hydrolase